MSLEVLFERSAAVFRCGDCSDRVQEVLSDLHVALLLPLHDVVNIRRDLLDHRPQSEQQSVQVRHWLFRRDRRVERPDRSSLSARRRRAPTGSSRHRRVPQQRLRQQLQPGPLGRRNREGGRDGFEEQAEGRGGEPDGGGGVGREGEGFGVEGEVERGRGCAFGVVEVLQEGGEGVEKRRGRVPVKP